VPSAIVRDLQFRLRDASGTYTFAYDGALELLDQQRIYQDTAAVPELAKIVETWEIRNCRIQAADANLLIDAWDTFLAFIDDRVTTPVTAFELLRPAAGGDAEEIERQVAAPTYQNIRLESVTVGTDPVLPGAEWRSVVPVTLRLSAERTFPDGNGIVLWDQRIRNTYTDGLHTLEWVVTLETAEGTDARVKAKAFAAIPITTYGDSYVWATNGTGGVDIEEEDAQTFDDGAGATAARTPRRVVAVSRIQQLGISTGPNTAGNSINDPISYENETLIEGTTKTTIRRAEAHGPGALAWVESQALTGDLSYSSVVEEQAHRAARGEWRKVDQEDDNEGARWRIKGVITGGAQTEEFVLLTGVQPPRLTIGPLHPARLDVEVVVEFAGPRPSRDDMAFPAPLSFPWRLILPLSKEDAWPERTTAGQDSWQRRAVLVYESATVPAYSSLRALAQGDPARTVRSYWL